MDRKTLKILFTKERLFGLIIEKNLSNKFIKLAIS